MDDNKESESVVARKARKASLRRVSHAKGLEILTNMTGFSGGSRVSMTPTNINNKIEGTSRPPTHHRQATKMGQIDSNLSNLLKSQNNKNYNDNAANIDANEEDEEDAEDDDDDALLGRGFRAESDHMRQQTVLNPSDLASIAQALVNPSLDTQAAVSPHASPSITTIRNKKSMKSMKPNTTNTNSSYGDTNNIFNSNPTNSMSTSNSRSNGRKSSNRRPRTSNPPRVDAFSLFSNAPASTPTHSHPAVQDLFSVVEPKPVPQRRVSQANRLNDGGISPHIANGLTNPRLNISIGECHEQGKRPEMEDECTILLSTQPSQTSQTSQTSQMNEINDEENDCAFLAVYDGHAGGETSKFLKQELHRHILTHSSFPNEIQKSIMEGCRSCDLCCGETSGSTAVMCLVFQHQLWFANVGDSEAVLCVRGRAVPMSKPHRPCECNQGKKCKCPETLRIKAAGGFVLRKRIMGLLAVSRAFGDVDSKPTHPASTLGTYGGTYKGDFVISTPYVTNHPIDDSTEFVVLACDGLFDVLTYQVVVDIARNSLRKDGDVKVACKALVKRALEKGTTDNVSVVIICLNQN